MPPKSWDGKVGCGISKWKNNMNNQWNVIDHHYLRMYFNRQSTTSWITDGNRESDPGLWQGSWSPHRNSHSLVVNARWYHFSANQSKPRPLFTSSIWIFQKLLSCSEAGTRVIQKPAPAAFSSSTSSNTVWPKRVTEKAFDWPKRVTV